MKLAASATALGLFLAFSVGCASTPKYLIEDCPLYTELDPIKVNPAGALDRHLYVEAVLRVCPPEEGLEELRRKRIELKHELIALLSSKTREELEHPLRIENLKQEIQLRVNERLMRKGRVVDVSVTDFELR